MAMLLSPLNAMNAFGRVPGLCLLFSSNIFSGAPGLQPGAASRQAEFALAGALIQRPDAGRGWVNNKIDITAKGYLKKDVPNLI